MVADDFFISRAPESLPEDQLYKLLWEVKSGSTEARNEVITRNIRLVIHIVATKFNATGFDMSELVSTGILGLIKAVDSYDIKKGCKFATYAGKCISNEINVLLRKGKKDYSLISLESPIYLDDTDNKLRIENIISDEEDIVFDYELNEEYAAVRKIVESLPEREKTIIELYYGFNDDIPLAQHEIAKKLNLSQPYISKVIIKTLKKIELKLLCVDEKDREVKSVNTALIDMASVTRKGQSFYDFFKGYSKEYLDEILKMLSPDELSVLKARYGGDLNNPFYHKLCYDDYKKYYNVVIPKVKRLLANNGKVSKSGRKPKNLSDDIKMSVTINNDVFVELANRLSPKETVITALRFGVIDGKHYTAQSIANYFGMDSIEVIGILKNALVVYKECITEQEKDKIPTFFDI